MPNHSEPRRVGVVMAGGSGERFWPLSRRRRPKQLLRLTSQTQTMLAEAVSRVAPVIPPEDVYIVTGKHLVEPIREARVGLPDENVIAEPVKRNTAGCLVYAAAYLVAKYGEDRPLSMAVLTADHVIRDNEAFCAAVEAALRAAEQEDALTTIGVVPTRPETGYGYVQIPEDNAPLPSFAEGVPVYRVVGFHEKPDPERAKAYFTSGRYLWNIGMFFWTIPAFMAELEAARPGHARAVRAMTAAMRAGDAAEVDRVFEALEDISIDYALMERARNVAVARAEFHWDDVGAWNALDRTLPCDDKRNIALGDPVLVDCEDCIVYNETAGDPHDRAVAVVGARDLVVVATPDAVLVMPKDRAQDVRRAVAELKERNAAQL